MEPGKPLAFRRNPARPLDGYRLGGRYDD